MYSTNHCAQLRASHEDQTVTLVGWVHRIRDHGGLRFVDLRDSRGITQIVASRGHKCFVAFESVRLEWCVQVTGKVVRRAPHLVNKELETGEIEVRAETVTVISQAPDLPFAVNSEERAPFETRLKYRFLDLRRKEVAQRMILRSKVIAHMRQQMWAQGFMEHQTPILTAPSPEGARDFLVPSSKHPGRFYALPQAPQLFKQMLMVGGFEKYFQVAPCFRDETARSDRLPTEFYQLDMEMAFVTQEDVFALVETVLGSVFKTFSKEDVAIAWPRIAYEDAKLWYGTDKPDLRCPLKMSDVSDYFKTGGFAVFEKVLKGEGAVIRALPAPGGGRRKFCESMDKQAREAGLAGMAWIYWDEQGQAKGPVAKAMGEKSEALRIDLGLSAGDAVFFLAGKPKEFLPFAAQARVTIGKDLGVWSEGFAFAWIVDFPLFEETEDGYAFEHNPFSMPQGGAAALKGDPLKVKGYQYDLACNGYELLSGAIRCHERETLFESFAIAGYSREEVLARFGGLLRALEYSPPPHGGCAIGIERVIMLLSGETSIREVVMFPMTQGGDDLLMEGPKEITKEERKLLGL